MTVGHLLLIVGLAAAALAFLAAFGIVGAWSIGTLIGLLVIAVAALIVAALAG